MVSRRKIRARFAAVLLLALVNGCKGEEAASELTWGHLNYVNQDHLINLRPNSRIVLCGDYRDVLAEGIRKWAVAIGRDKYLAIDTTCSGSGKIIQIYGEDKVKQDKLASYNCDLQGSAAYTLSGVPVPRIYICNYLGDDLDNTLLHEAGHLWGLCDQYEAGLSKCHVSYRSANPASTTSIMGNSSKFEDLQPDDITGIRKLAERTDIPANSEWQRLLGTNGNGSGTTTVGGVSGDGASNNSAGNTGSFDGGQTTHTQCLNLDRVQIPAIDAVACDGVFGQTRGAMLSATTPGGVADRLGLKNGDLILAVAGQRVSDARTLSSFLYDLSVAGQAFLIQAADSWGQIKRVQVGSRNDPSSSPTTASTVTGATSPGVGSSSAPSTTSTTNTGSGATPSGTPRCLTTERFVWSALGDLVVCNAAQGTTPGLMVTSQGRGLGAQIGLQIGDMIVYVDGEPTPNSQHLARFQSSLYQGSKIYFYRGSRKLYAQVK